ncbi:insulinase family protein [Candidatus Saccharibacteria bacterium]|jgi:predicted Zn-dependent peptidase|nr:insulinase family protein [Candidatus Saccharibacteria bacterium]
MTVEKAKLQNGMSIYVDHIDGALVNEINVHVPYGSVHEAPGEEGVAHVFEHSVFLQTKKFKTDTAMVRYTKLHGVDINAHTNYTSTVYDGSGIDIEPSLVYLSEVLQYPQFPVKKFDHEMKAIRREIAEGWDNTDAMHEMALWYSMFGLPYGRDIGGHHGKLDFTADQMHDIFERCYKIGRMSLVVAGAATLDEVVGVAERYFDTDSDNTSKLKEPRKPRIARGGRRTGTIDDNSYSANVSVGFPMTAEFRRKYNADRLVYRLAEQAMTENLFNDLRTKRGISYGASLSADDSNHPNAWGYVASTSVDDKHVEKAIRIMRETFLMGSESYKDIDLRGQIAVEKYSLARQVPMIGARSLRVLDALNGYYAIREIADDYEQIKETEPEDIREAIDEIVDLASLSPEFIHVTGTVEAVGPADKLIDLHEIA